MGHWSDEVTSRIYTPGLSAVVFLQCLLFGTVQVTRDKNVIKPAKGKRQCNCKNKMVTKQLGPGMFQQFQTQECEQCSNVKFARESETLQVTVEPGMKDKEVLTFVLLVAYKFCCFHLHLYLHGCAASGCIRHVCLSVN